MAKKLFIARIEVEFAFLGDHTSDAGDFVDDVIRDADGLYVVGEPVTFTKTGAPLPPEGWDLDALVYGSDDDITFGEAAEHEKRRRHDEMMAHKQADLFGEKKT